MSGLSIQPSEYTERWLSAKQLDDYTKHHLDRSRYYQLTGVSGKICEYLSQPALWCSKLENFSSNLDSCLLRIMKVALQIILFLPSILGILSRSAVQFFVGETIGKATYDKEWQDWTEKKLFQKSVFSSSYGSFIDFCIRNRIKADECPFKCIAMYKNLGVNGTIPYLFNQFDSFFYKLDQDNNTQQGQDLLIIADLDYSINYNIKDQFKKNNENKPLPCGVAVLRPRVYGDEFSEDWIKSAIHDIRNKPEIE